MKAWKASLAVATMVALAASAAAQCKSKSSSASAGCNVKAAAKNTSSDESGRCWGEALAATGMPLVKVKVGDKSTKCPVLAKDLVAKDSSVKPVFFIGDKEYSDCGKVAADYETALQAYLDRMTQVRYAVGSECVACPNHAKMMADSKGKKMQFRVASYDFDNREKANRAVEVAREAAERVTMRMVVDGKQYDCSKACFQKAAAGCCSSKAVSASAKKSCGASGKTVAASEKKSCGVSGKTVAAGDKKSCGASGKTVAASDKKSCGASGKTVAASDKKGCGASGKTVAASTKKSCCASGKSTAQTASATGRDKSACGIKSAKTASSCCPKSGGAKQVIAGNNCEYIVGDQRTSCQQTARIQLMQARIVAAHRAVAELNGKSVAGL